MIKPKALVIKSVETPCYHLLIVTLIHHLGLLSTPFNKHYVDAIKAPLPLKGLVLTPGV